MRVRRWEERWSIGRHDRREVRFQSLMRRVTQSALTVNLKVAKPHGIRIPQSILLRADEVIR